MAIVSIRRCFLLALTAVLCSGAVASAQTSLTGRTIRLLALGDYVLPRFSPSGQLLAISEVLADTVHENTQILILNMRRSALDTLLPAEAAAKYATYKAYVSDFEWLSDSSLLAWIPDGDVGAAAVTFNVRSKRIIREEHHEGEEDSIPPYQPLADSLGRLYPDVATPRASPSDVFGSALSWPTVRVRSAVLLQKRYAGVDDDVWLYRLDRPDAKRILPLSGGPRASLSVRRQRGDNVWFILRVHESYEHGNNPAFLYDGERLLPFADYAELADFDVHPATRRIAFVYWDGTQRHLAVKELVPK